MNHFPTIHFIFLTIVLPGILSFPNGAPETAETCRKMLPGHGPLPQKSPSPFQVTTNVNSVRSDSQVEVTIGFRPARNVREFKGFFIQARNEEGLPIGTFKPIEGVTTRSCGLLKNNAATHSNNSPKQSIALIWTPPTNYTGLVTFTATIVEDFETFWTFVKAQPLHVQNVDIPERQEKEEEPSIWSQISTFFVKLWSK